MKKLIISALALFSLLNMPLGAMDQLQKQIAKKFTPIIVNMSGNQGSTKSALPPQEQTSLSNKEAVSFEAQCPYCTMKSIGTTKDNCTNSLKRHIIKICRMIPNDMWQAAAKNWRDEGSEITCTLCNKKFDKSSTRKNSSNIYQDSFGNIRNHKCGDKKKPGEIFYDTATIEPIKTRTLGISSENACKIAAKRKGLDRPETEQSTKKQKKTPLKITVEEEVSFASQCPYCTMKSISTTQSTCKNNLKRHIIKTCRMIPNDTWQTVAKNWRDEGSEITCTLCNEKFNKNSVSGRNTTRTHQDSFGNIRNHKCGDKKQAGESFYNTATIAPTKKTTTISYCAMCPDCNQAFKRKSKDDILQSMNIHNQVCDKSKNNPTEYIEDKQSQLPDSLIEKKSNDTELYSIDLSDDEMFDISGPTDISDFLTENDEKFEISGPLEINNLLFEDTDTEYAVMEYNEDYFVSEDFGITELPDLTDLLDDTETDIQDIEFF